MTRTLTPDELKAWAARISELIADAEIELIRQLRLQIAADMGAGQHRVMNLARLASVRATLEQRLQGDWQQVLDETQAVLDAARQAGQGQAERDLRAYHKTNPLPVGEQTLHAVAMIARETMDAMAAVPALILRDVWDQYRELMAQPVANVVTGAATTRRAIEQALGDYAKAGIHAFQDRSGRWWHLDAYAEMAVRTGAMRAMRAGYQQTLVDGGFDLVQVTGNTYACDKCGPWQGTVLSIDPRVGAGVHRYPHTITGEPVAVRVMGTVEEAEAAGLFHPNCTHRMVAYLPGVTSKVDEQVEEDPDTYEQSQVQRALERDIRKLKREEAASMDPRHRKQLQAKIRHRQKQIRELVAGNPKLQRQSYREQIRREATTPTKRWEANPTQ